MKQWIRLFCLSQRSWLEESLNEFIRDHKVTDVKVWNDENCWNALVRYEFEEAPTYNKHTEE